MHHPDLSEIVVLNDGETFTGADGCTVRFIPESIVNDGDAIEDGLREDNFESERVLCASDVIDVAGSLLEPSELDGNPEYFRALTELCNQLRVRTADEIELTEAELVEAAKR